MRHHEARPRKVRPLVGLLTALLMLSALAYGPPRESSASGCTREWRVKMQYGEYFAYQARGQSGGGA